VANNYFKFKQFIINQGDCAMKVTTDGCVFGALATAKNPQKILDIGTGTGLLSLMLAQKYPLANIHAVEIDKGAFAQAKENFEVSPWEGNFSIHLGTVQTFTIDHKCDLIVCNPPFFKNSLLGDRHSKNLAIHDYSLSQEDLIQCVVRLLAEDGVFWVLYPQREALGFRDEALKGGLFLENEIIIYNHPQSEVFRVVQKFSFMKKECVSEQLVIKDAEANYTEDFISLLSPYYLHL
jgi:tRNA1Val (adenine37-N6)-methyltransferase